MLPPNTLWGIPNVEPLTKVTVPLTTEHSYEDFLKRLRPIRRKKKPPQK